MQQQNYRKQNIDDASIMSHVAKMTRYRSPPRDIISAQEGMSFVLNEHSLFRIKTTFVSNETRQNDKPFAASGQSVLS